ncbi:MAG TPA: GNAT family N-acetyltransferase [Gemmatimonadaceae bacterium]|nr:GNAT family N-acetyltransferase [Gemmatimonadaceae bacterium]
MPDISAESVRNNKEAGRFEIDLDGEPAVSNYSIKGDTIYFTHTEVPQALEGRGIGNILARVALDYARANRLRVVPRCKFIASFIERHPDYQDLVTADEPGPAAAAISRRRASPAKG